MALSIESPVSDLSGVGPKRAKALTERGIATVGDLVFHLPARYQDWRTRTSMGELQQGMTAVVEGRLDGVSERPMRGMRWRRMASGWIVGASGERIRVVWFNLPAYMRGRMPSGERVVVHGKITAGGDGSLEIAHPALHVLRTGEPPAIRPVYRLPAGIGQRIYAALVVQALDKLKGRIAGAVPDELRAEARFADLQQALFELHCPPPGADLGKLESGGTNAHFALAFDEMFAFQLALRIERERAARRSGAVLDAPARLTSRFLNELPFRPTGSQSEAIAEIGRDLSGPRQMNRLLMGDVGSGKTLVAFWSALRAIESGCQAAMMAPTELLAEQHYRSFRELCGALAVESALLTGKTAGDERRAILDGLARGELPLVFGTHALIQQGVRIRKLGLAIIDEQHRFGVFDRARLIGLGATTNVLLMTATPIPRSLAMTLFANLDVSSLDEMPPGRMPVATEIFGEEEISAVDAIVRRELGAGNRAYYVVPLIENGEEDGEDEMSSVAAMAKRLRDGPLKGLRIGTMHGRMRPAEKERTMRAFRDGAIDVLVSTTVVEVGIDVTEATAIVIVAAERYGLAQLHQLRGRVGRGKLPSRCCLVASRGADEKARERLGVMVKSTNGREVARADLEMRGPGDLLGTRQTGALPLRFAHLIHDYSLIPRARAMAEEWMRRDPGLRSAVSAGARQALRRMLEVGFSLGDVG